MGKSSAELRGELNTLSSDRSSMEKRLGQLKKIKSNIETGLTDVIYDINTYYTQAKGDFLSGLKGVDGIETLAGGYDKFKQSAPNDDGTMSGCLYDVNCEISRCEQKIENYTSQMNAKLNEITQAVAEESAASQTKS